MRCSVQPVPAYQTCGGYVWSAQVQGPKRVQRFSHLSSHPRVSSTANHKATFCMAWLHLADLASAADLQGRAAKIQQRQ